MPNDARQLLVPLANNLDAVGDGQPVPAGRLPVATESVQGAMSAADKAKLDGLPLDEDLTISIAARLAKSANLSDLSNLPIALHNLGGGVDPTGTGAIVRQTSPTLFTPVLSGNFNFGGNSAIGIAGIFTSDGNNGIGVTNPAGGGLHFYQTGVSRMELTDTVLQLHVPINAPTLITPNVGAATGTSLALSGALSATGPVTVPDRTLGDNTSNAANTKFVKAATDAATAALVNSSPATLDTLKELADALGDDPNYATTTATLIGTKLAKASNLSDLASAATSRTNLGLGSVDNTSDASKPVSTAQQTALNLKADLASPALTGTPTINGIKQVTGTGSPEGVVTAAISSAYFQTDATGGSLWVKETGSGNTGWIKASNVISLRRFGAKGDGTTNDAPALASAATAAANGVLLVEPGTYRLSASVTIGSTVNTIVMPGAVFSVDSTFVITFSNGGLQMSPWQGLFTGAGTIITAGDKLGPRSVRWFGAVGDGATNDTPAFGKAGNNSFAPTQIDVPSGTYAIGGIGIVPLQTSYFRGAGMEVTTLKAITGTTFLFQTSSFVESLSVEDLTFDLNGIAGATAVALAAGSVGRILFRRCRFRGFTGSQIAMLIVGTRNLTIEDCVFEGLGNGSGTMISMTQGCRNFIIRRNKFRYFKSGIIIDTGSTTGTEEQVTENGRIVDNDFDGGWWLMVARFAGSGAGVSYTATVLTDTGAAFSSIVQFTTVRVMPVLRTGTATINGHSLTDASATFITSLVKAGYIVRIGTAFGVVMNVESETKLWVEEWLSDANRYPVASPVSGTYTVFGVVIGRVAAAGITSTTITVERWIDMDGATVSPPASSTLYEVLNDFPGYPINGESSSRNITVSRNRVRRGWSDQISTFGYRWTITDNDVSGGQDMGVTVQGGSNHVVSNNRIRHQGASGIACHCFDSVIDGNVITKSGWQNNDVQLGDIWVFGASRNIISNNQFNVDGSANNKKGIALAQTADANLITVNRFKDHTTAGVYLDQSTVTNNVVRNNIISGSGAGPAVVINAATGTDLGFVSGSASPEGAIFASPGMMYHQEDSLGGTFWKKYYGTGNVGWIPVPGTGHFPEFNGLMNRLAWSEGDFSAYSGGGVTGQADPWGTNRATQFTGASFAVAFFGTLNITGMGTTLYISFYAKAGTATSLLFSLYDQTTSLYLNPATGVGDSGASRQTVNLDSTWRLYKFVYNNLNPAHAHMILPAPATGTVFMTGFQVSDKDTTYLRTQGTAVTTPIFQDVMIGVATYGATVTPDLASGNIQTITVTNTTAFTIAAPLNPLKGRSLRLDIINSSGGAMGTITWNAVFKMDSSWANPANGKQKTIHFFYNGTNWIQDGAPSGDI